MDAFRPAIGRRLFCGPFEKADVAGITLAAQAAQRDRAFDRATVFVRMRAVRIGTEMHEGVKLQKITFNFFGNDVPQLKLPDSRRVDDPAAHLQFDQLSRGRRMLALLIDIADFANAKPELGLNYVEQSEERRVGKECRSRWSP